MFSLIVFLFSRSVRYGLAFLAPQAKIRRDDVSEDTSACLRDVLKRSCG
jgi:hypothetical protein